MEMPNFEAHEKYFEESGHVVEISSSAFNRVAAEYNNVYAVGVFGVMETSEPFERYIFVDKDLFEMPRPSNPEENFEDIKPFTVHHEMTELYGMLEDRISGRRKLNGIDTEHDETARYSHLKEAHEAGLLDKMLEFHMILQIICQRQIEVHFGRPHHDGPDAETIQIINKTYAIAERIRQESDNSSPSSISE